MNNEQFELTISDLAGSGTYYADIADELRARDTAQREAMARVEAEAGRLAEAGLAAHVKATAAQTQLADVLYILDQHRTWTGMGWEQLPVPVHAVEKIRSKLAQAEQQEAQGAQAGDEREAFEHWASDGGLYPNAVERRGDQYKLAQSHSYWQAWQARAALATQPAAPVADHPVVKALLEIAAAAFQALDNAGDGNSECMELARNDFERLDAAMDVLDELPDDHPGYVMEPPAKAAWALRNLNAVRGAEQ